MIIALLSSGRKDHLSGLLLDRSVARRRKRGRPSGYPGTRLNPWCPSAPWVCRAIAGLHRFAPTQRPADNDSVRFRKGRLRDGV